MTKTRSERAVKTAAERWRAGTQHYQEKVHRVNHEIHQKAKEMPNNNIDDAAAIVEMAVTKLRAFADEYHNEEG